MVDNNWVPGETAKVAVVAPVSGNQGLTQNVFLFGGPASGPGSILVTAGYQVLYPGLTGYLSFGSNTFTSQLTASNGVAIGNIPVPNNQSLVGSRYAFQAIVVDATCPVGQQISASNAVRVEIRSRGVGQPNTIPTTAQTSITHNGITFTFNQPVQTGEYVNGEKFVVVSASGTSVRLTSISPMPAGPNDFGNQYMRVFYATGGTFRLRYNGGAWSSPVSLYGSGGINDAAVNSQLTAALTSIGLTVGAVANDNVQVNNIAIVGMSNLRVAATNTPVTSLLQVDEAGLVRWGYAPLGALSAMCQTLLHAAAINLRDAAHGVYASGHPAGITTGPNCGYPLAANAGYTLRQQGFLDLFPGQTLQASENHTSPAVITISQIAVKRYSPLYVVATAPQVGTFAPPAQESFKFELSENEANFALLQSLARPAGAPAVDFNQLAASLRAVMYAPYTSTGYGYRQIVSCLAGPQGNGCMNYGGGFAALLGDVLRELNLNNTLSQKTAMLRLLTGWAINWYGQNLGFSGSRASFGGQQSGDMAAPAIGHLFNFPAMKFKHAASGRLPGEDQQIQQITQAMINNTSLGYNQNHLGQFDWRMNNESTASNFWVEGAQPYRFCCTARYWQDTWLAYRFMGIVNLLAMNGWSEYMERYNSASINPLLSTWGYDDAITPPVMQTYGGAFPPP
jgi:hypothetical protein